ncbi:AcrR family transcriptional regulator [Catenuloplanes nepalensis]|uniref:AcrR family transcriptional regulator n=1 Tax=Catenuloplanes nepalensis TaxID=587533 RepID=A0ABT9MWJ2_9ACTN|nr:TetR/AcrR family transcriptional regulator C-terminal domain-containing protein [Catenuloplanes nepalensis]MDP9795806.1 AcrR family transcriptional regulator [Catenuloplanes nepalensis]
MASRKTDPFTDSVWLREPGRPRGGAPTLTREQIVRTAIELLDAEGAEGLSMRRLGTRLGSGATSLYWHVTNKNELLELAVDEIMGEIYVPEPGDVSFRIGASVYANGLRAMLLRHPWAIPLLGTHPNLGPNALRVGDRITKLFVAGGFAGMTLSHASALITNHAVGAALSTAAVAASTTSAGLTPAEVQARVAPLLERVAADYPNYEAWRRTIGDAPMDPSMWEENFNFGLERVLDGLESWLATRNA